MGLFQKRMAVDVACCLETLDATSRAFLLAAYYYWIYALFNKFIYTFFQLDCLFIQFYIALLAIISVLFRFILNQ